MIDRAEVVALAKALRAAGVLELQTPELSLKLAPEQLTDPAPRGEEESEPLKVATPEYRSALDIMLGGSGGAH